MTHSVSTNPPKVRYIVAGPVRGKDGPVWAVVDKERASSKILCYFESSELAMQLATALNGEQVYG